MSCLSREKRAGLDATSFSVSGSKYRGTLLNVCANMRIHAECRREYLQNCDAPEPQHRVLPMGGNEMKRRFLDCFLTLVALVMLSLLTFAQHGGAGGMGGGRPAGAGPGSTGAPAGIGSEGSGRPGDMGSTGMSHSSAASQSPTKVLDNTKLDSSLTNALVKSGITVPGGDLKTACSAFKNLGQCIAAMHVAKNLDIPGGFDALKEKMTGTNAVSLGKAIGELSPNANAKAESKKATKEANHEISAAESSS
jgi:hypothetical protein